MCPTFTDDDVEKPVVDGAGEEVGVVASVEGDIAHVRPSVDAVDSIKSSIGWEAVADESQPLDTDAVREITDEVVRLEDELPMAEDGESSEPTTPEPTARGDADTPETEPAGGSAGLEETEVLRDETDEERPEETDAIDADGTDGRGEGEPDRGLEADPVELADETRASGMRTDASVEPDDDHRSTDASVDPDREPRRTDAAVDPGEQPRRTDAEVDPDAVEEATSTGGPTTEDAGRTDLEDGPEERRLDAEDDDSDAGEST